MPMPVRFLFDYLSPFAYLAWHNLPVLMRRIPQVEIQHTPIAFSELLKHWGQKRPSEIPPKRAYVLTHCLRVATQQQIPFTLPKFHPFNSTTSLCLSLPQVSGQQQTRVIGALWRAGWQQGRDLGSKDELAKILSENDLSADLLEKANDSSIQESLKTNTKQLIEKHGVFGVPTFLTPNNTLFWGLDSLPQLEAHLNSEEKIDAQHLAEILKRKSGVALSISSSQPQPPTCTSPRFSL